jgi:hypothetical protein
MSGFENIYQYGMLGRIPKRTKKKDQHTELLEISYIVICVVPCQPLDVLMDQFLRKDTHFEFLFFSNFSPGYSKS